MNEKPIKNASLEELRKMKDDGKLLVAKKATSPEDLPDGFWDDAEIVDQKTKVAVSLRIDQDILAFFKDQGKGHLTRMNAVLRSYVEAQRSR